MHFRQFLYFVGFSFVVVNSDGQHNSTEQMYSVSLSEGPIKYELHYKAPSVSLEVTNLTDGDVTLYVPKASIVDNELPWIQFRMRDKNGTLVSKIEENSDSWYTPGLYGSDAILKLEPLPLGPKKSFTWTMNTSALGKEITHRSIFKETGSTFLHPYLIQMRIRCELLNNSLRPEHADFFKGAEPADFQHITSKWLLVNP